MDYRLVSPQVSKINASPWYSILMDSSTDISGEDHLLIYVRYLAGAHFLIATTEYLCTVRVVSKTAEVVYNVLNKVLAALKIDKQRMRGFCSDGGSEFAGCHAGLAARLKADVPGLIFSHCAPHRFALSMGDAAKHDKCQSWLDRVDTILKTAHSLFSRATKRLAWWQTFATSYYLTRLKFPIYNATRWFSRSDCVYVLVASLPVLLLFLKAYEHTTKLNKGKVTKEHWKAGGELYRLLLDPMFVSGLMIMCDVLKRCDLCSVSLQRDCLMIHNVQPLIKGTCTDLDNMITADPDGRLHYSEKLLPTYHGFKQRYDDRSGRWRFADGKRVFLEPSLFDEFSPSAETESLEVLSDLISVFKESLITRFPSAPLCRAFGVFDPASYASTTRGNLDHFLSHEFTGLVGHLKNTMPLGENRQLYVGKLQAQFRAMRVRLFDLPKNSNGEFLSVLDTWCLFASHYAEEFPLMFDYVRIAFALPVQSACVERGFSVHRRIKFCLTNRLGVSVVDSLMRMKLVFSRDMKEWVESPLLAEATLLLQSSGFSGKEHPLTLGRLFEACNEAVPRYLGDGIDALGNVEGIDFGELSGESCEERSESEGEEVVPDGDATDEDDVAGEKDGLEGLSESMFK